MGYIAPINQYEYAQYQNREIGVSYDPYKIIPVARIAPPQKRAALADTEVAPAPFFILPEKTSKKAVKQDRVQKLYGEMTGRGRLFNESV